MTDELLFCFVVTLLGWAEGLKASRSTSSAKFANSPNTEDPNSTALLTPILGATS